MPKKAKWKQGPALAAAQASAEPITMSQEAEAERVAEHHHHHHHPGGDPVAKQDTCANCKFAQGHENPDLVYCKRFPPAVQPAGLSVFPILVSGNWCGEFQSAKSA